MYIGMRGHDFDTNTLDALCEKCKEYGVGGVQLVLLRSLADLRKVILHLNMLINR